MEIRNGLEGLSDEGPRVIELPLGNEPVFNQELAHSFSTWRWFIY